MRRSDKEITDRREIDDVILGSEVCHLGMVDRDGPYVIPISFGYDDGSVFIHTAKHGRKIEIMTRDPRVCVEFERMVELVTDDKDACKWTVSFESAIGFGRVTELVNDDDKTHGLNRIMRHYSGRDWAYEGPHFEATRVWRIDLESLTGKRSEPGA